MAPGSGAENAVEDSIVDNDEENDRLITDNGVEKHVADTNTDQFIKKIMKVYKALRVLERNKSKDTPTFSRAIEKLIRFFSKTFPSNCGIEGNLNDLN